MGLQSPVEKLIAARARLVEARASGIRRTRDANGEEIEFKTDREMAVALVNLDSEIAKASGRSTPAVFHFVTSKGV